MKLLMSAIAMIALLGFVGFTHAEDAPKKTHTHKGTFVKVEGTELTYKGAREPHLEHKIAITDKTKVTVDGKEAKIADIKANMFLAITEEPDKTAGMIVASTKAPTTKPSK